MAVGLNTSSELMLLMTIIRSTELCSAPGVQMFGHPGKPGDIPTY